MFPAEYLNFRTGWGLRKKQKKGQKQIPCSAGRAVRFANPRARQGNDSYEDVSGKWLNHWI